MRAHVTQYSHVPSVISSVGKKGELRIATARLLQTLRCAQTHNFFPVPGF